MRYIKEILKKNSIWVLVYIGLGIFNSFVANYKVDYFQKVIDGLADRTLAFRKKMCKRNDIRRT